MELSILDALNISLTGFVVVLIILALLAVIIVLLSKIIRIVENAGNSKDENVVKDNNTKSAPAVTPAPVAAAPAATPVAYCNGVELYKTDDKTAATIMAIVSHQSGIPLDRLVFKSIKLIEK